MATAGVARAARTGDAGSALQTKLVERSTALLRPDRPLPLDSRLGEWFVGAFLPDKAKKYGFSFDVAHAYQIFPQEQEHAGSPLLHSVVLKDVPEVPGAKMQLIEKIAMQMQAVAEDPDGLQTATAVPPLEQSFVFDDDMEATGTPALACVGCKWWDSIEGYSGKCLPASSLGRGKQGIREYVYKKRHHQTFPQTEMMEDGSVGHKKIEVIREPIKDTELVLESLLEGKRTPFVLQICNDRSGFRATPDLMIGQLAKTDSGWQLLLFIIEDKPFPKKEYMVQLGQEVEIVRVRDHFRVAPPDLAYQEAIRFKRYSLLDEIEKRMRKGGVLGEHERVTLATWYALNPYGNQYHPIDNYSWILRGPQPQGMKYPPRLYSIDGALQRGAEEGNADGGKSWNDILWARVHQMKNALRDAYHHGIHTSRKGKPRGRRKRSPFVFETEETIAMKATTVVGALRRERRYRQQSL